MGESTASYHYDPAGNLVRIVRGDSGLDIAPNALNQIAAADGTVYRYDANGNLIDNGKRLYTGMRPTGS